MIHGWIVDMYSSVVVIGVVVLDFAIIAAIILFHSRECEMMWDSPTSNTLKTLLHFLCF